jgi:hypothetical protein
LTRALAASLYVTKARTCLGKTGTRRAARSGGSSSDAATGGASAVGGPGSLATTSSVLAAWQSARPASLGAKERLS